MADASVSKTDVRKDVGVRISLSAPATLNTRRAIASAGHERLAKRQYSHGTANGRGPNPELDRKRRSSVSVA
jgi:hypothetical protein